MTQTPTAPTAPLATGLRWRAGVPALELTGPTGIPTRLPFEPGAEFDWALAGEPGGPGKRCCVGVWQSTEGVRRHCVHAATIRATSPDAQCRVCAWSDRGRLLARDALPDDGRRYALYLAWFGPGLFKVGMTAEDRGTNRLAEQGAVAFSWLARGSMTGIRQAERQAAATGIASERIRYRAKAGAWYSLPSAPQRAAAVAEGHAAITAAVQLSDGLERADCEVVDQAALFGLDRLPPPPVREVRAFTAGATLAGRVLVLTGRLALVATGDETLLLDTRLLDGWRLAATSEAGGRGSTGLELAGLGDLWKQAAAGQDSLF